VQTDLSLVFARVLLATAWADDDLAPDEVASLRTSLRQLPAILGLEPLSDAQWSALEPLLQTPVSAVQRAVWIADLREQIADEAQLNLVIAGIDRLMRADRVLTPAERQVAEEIRLALQDLDVSAAAGLFRRIRRALNLHFPPHMRDAEARRRE
jgi:hypothetical protein